MKKLAAAISIALSSACAIAHGQALDLQSGYSQQPLFTLDYNTAGGFDLDSSGDIFFMGASAEAQAGYEQDQVDEATASSGYNDISVNTQLPEIGYGNFVTINNGAIYSSLYIDQNDGDIYSSSVSGTTANPNFVGNIPSNYDLEFSGTTPYVSADVTGTDNEVFTLNPGTGATKPVLDTGGDFSGPIAFTASGGLIYGGAGPVFVTNSNGQMIDEGGIPDIYIFSAAATTSGSTLKLSDAEMVIDNSGNGSIVMGPDNELFQAFDPHIGTGSITEYDLTTGSSTLIATLPANTDQYDFNGIRYFDGSLIAGVADYDDGVTDFIQINTIPEPRAAPLCVAGLLLAAFLRRRFSTRSTTRRTNS